MQDSHLLDCTATCLVSTSQCGLSTAQKGTRTVLAAKADGVCGQCKFRLSISPLKRKCTCLKMGPGSAADIWDASKSLSSACYWLYRGFPHLFTSNNSILQDCVASCHQKRWIRHWSAAWGEQTHNWSQHACQCRIEDELVPGCVWHLHICIIKNILVKITTKFVFKRLGLV